MITYILVFIVLAMLAGFLVQGYEGVFFTLEVPGYSIEANVVFVALVVSIAVLVVVLVARSCFAFAMCVHKIKCRVLAKQYENIGRCYAYLSIGDIDDVRQIENIPIKLHKQNCSVMAQLKGCACFRLGQYEVAEKYFSLLPPRGLPDGRLGVWLVRTLELEQSKDCKLRVLNRLSHLFSTKPWVSLLRLEAAKMECRWQDVLYELKFIFRNGIPHPYDLSGLRDIACCKLAEICYKRGDYREGLGLVKNVSGIQATILATKFHVKLNNIKRAITRLEEHFRIDPHPDIADLYLAISQDSNVAAERLCGLDPECYVSSLLIIRKYISLKQYNAAEQHIKRAIEKYKYVQLYCLMIEVMVHLGDLGEISFWADAMRKDSIPNMRWECSQCSTKSEKWDHECANCGKFNSIRWVV